MSKEDEAKLHIEKAEKSLKTSFLKRKPEVEVAIDEYGKAAACYKSIRKHKEAADVLLKIADLHKQKGSLFHEAKNLEQAAMHLKELKDFDQVYILLKQAGMNFQLSGAPDTASIMLDKGAKILEEAAPLNAGDLYLRSADASEIESKWQTAAEACGQAARMFVRIGDFNKTISALQKKVDYCSKEGWSAADVAGRAITALVLVHLSLGDSVAARRIYENAVNSSTDFGRSNDVSSVSQLLNAYDEYDSERAKILISTPTFRNLDNDFVKLARTIEFPSLDGVGGGGGAGGETNDNNEPRDDLGDQVEDEGLL